MYVNLPGEHNFWYSINYGNVHFTFMSTEHPYTPGTPQREWLEKVGEYFIGTDRNQDLAEAEKHRDVYPWLIVSGHRPMYCSDTDEWNAHRPGAFFQTEIEPVFHKYNVDLYLCGHQHMYERIYPGE